VPALYQEDGRVSLSMVGLEASFALIAAAVSPRLVFRNPLPNFTSDPGRPGWGGVWPGSLSGSPIGRRGSTTRCRHGRCRARSQRPPRSPTANDPERPPMPILPPLIRAARPLRIIKPFAHPFSPKWRARFCAVAFARGWVGGVSKLRCSFLRSWWCPWPNLMIFAAS